MGVYHDKCWVYLYRLGKKDGSGVVVFMLASANWLRHDSSGCRNRDDRLFNTSSASGMGVYWCGVRSWHWNFDHCVMALGEVVCRYGLVHSVKAVCLSKIFSITFHNALLFQATKKLLFKTYKIYLETCHVRLTADPGDL